MSEDNISARDFTSGGPSVECVKNAGFCFGVKRAVEETDRQLNMGKAVCTLGEIIHNPQIVDKFKKRGCRVISDVSQAEPDETVIIRSHGISKKNFEELRARNLKYIDCTCPFVGKIHKIVSETGPGITLIAGDPPDHPEVVGIIGHCISEAYIFKNSSELLNILDRFENKHQENFYLVSQTTFDLDEWNFCANIVKKECTNYFLFDTICNETRTRQNETESLAKKSGLMIVVGGKKSSNTLKLKNISEKYCNTILIETADELYGIKTAFPSNIGITAGASTPMGIIKEVQKTMSEILIGNTGEEMSFEEMLEQNFKNTYTGERVTGTVTRITPTEIVVDIGAKQSGYIPIAEFTTDSETKLEDLVNVGDQLDLIVTRVNDVEGIITLSKKRVDSIIGFEKIMNAVETGEVFDGTVVEVVRGGVLAVTYGIKVFIPASQATQNRNEELESLLKKHVKFKILETNRQRRRAVGSIRAASREQKKMQEQAFWDNIEVGNTYKGVVKSIMSYGVFVDLGGVDGMVHISELSWNRARHPSDIVKVGDVLEVFVKDVTPETRKISLGHKKDNENPWEILKAKYSVGAHAKVKIVSMTTFGAFAQLLPGIDGLIHISQIAREHVVKPQDVLSIGQEVDVKITEIDYDKKRISLSIMAYLQDIEEAAAGEKQADAESDVNSET